MGKYATAELQATSRTGIVLYLTPKYLEVAYDYTSGPNAESQKSDVPGAASAKHKPSSAYLSSPVSHMHALL